MTIAFPSPAADDESRGAAASSDGRIGVIDIGSNSIRLVVYDGLNRAPLPVFNEKVLCGLGRTLADTGRLDPNGVVQALDNLDRFNRLARGMDLARLDVLATAAVRDAEDGADFVTAVERRTGLTVAVISGAEEARLSAMGVLSGFPGAAGVMGDLGGGSLELVGLDEGRIVRQVTLPLGPLRLMAGKGGMSDAVEVVENALSAESWLSDYRGTAFFPVGGAWRSVAKVHMAKVRHPLRVIQHYTVPGKDLSQLAGLIARQGKSSLDRLPNVSKRRLETLPMGCLVLHRLLEVLAPRQVVYSAFGLREGHLFDLLPEDGRQGDPLIEACARIAHAVDRFGHGDAVATWIAPLFADQPQRFARLRYAACLLGDIAWAEHPDYRAEHGYLKVLRLPVAGIDHADRVFLATAVYVRYGGDSDDKAKMVARELLDPDDLDHAVSIGLAMRLAHTLTGGVTDLLQCASLTREKDRLRLALEPGEEFLAGDAVRRRLDGLARALGLNGKMDGETKNASVA